MADKNEEANMNNDEKENNDKINETSESQGKSRRSTLVFLLGVVILFAVFFIIILVYPKLMTGDENSSGSYEYDYNNFHFKMMRGLWVTQVQIQGTDKINTIPLHFGPREVENITVIGPIRGYDASYVQYGEIRNIYVTFDPDEPDLSYVALTMSELTGTLADVLRINSTAVCTINVTGVCSERETITCETAKQKPVPVIYLSYKEPTMLKLENNCLTIQGNGTEIIRAADRLIYEWLSVMK